MKKRKVHYSVGDLVYFMQGKHVCDIGIVIDIMHDRYIRVSWGELEGQTVHCIDNASYVKLAKAVYIPEGD